MGSHHPAYLLKNPEDQRWKTDVALQRWALSLPEWTTAWDKGRTKIFENTYRQVTKAGKSHELYSLAVHSDKQKREKAVEAAKEEERIKRAKEQKKKNDRLKKARSKQSKKEESDSVKT